jgi:hypothetical protein
LHAVEQQVVDGAEECERRLLAVPGQRRQFEQRLIVGHHAE